MKKEIFIELSNLYLMNELEENEKIEFENAMMENDDLKKQFDEIKGLFESINDNRPDKIDEKLLVSARNSLMRTIRTENAKPTLKEKVFGILRNIFVSNYKLTFGSVGILFAGVFIGYLFFATNALQHNIIETPNSVNIDEIQNNDLKIQNIRIPSTLGGEGKIEISFDAIKPISYSGTADDPVIQKLLASALVTEKNPGVRLRTVNAISSQVGSDKTLPDPKIKNALITALEVDENPAVRKEALNTLMKLPFDTDIRDAFLFVLSNDRNSGMRVAAINALAQLKVEGTSLDDKIVNVLNRKAENDESDFIRLRAASLVQEVK